MKSNSKPIKRERSLRQRRKMKSQSTPVATSSTSAKSSVQKKEAKAPVKNKSIEKKAIPPQSKDNGSDSDTESLIISQKN